MLRQCLTTKSRTTSYSYVEKQLGDAIVWEDEQLQRLSEILDWISMIQEEVVYLCASDSL